MYHAACKVEFQPFVHTADVFQLFIKSHVAGSLLRYATQTAPTHLPDGIEAIGAHASTSLLRITMSTEVFFLASKCDWRSRSLKKLVEVALTRGVEDQTGWP